MNQRNLLTSHDARSRRSEFPVDRRTPLHTGAYCTDIARRPGHKVTMAVSAGWPMKCPHLRLGAFTLSRTPKQEHSATAPAAVPHEKAGHPDEVRSTSRTQWTAAPQARAVTRIGSAGHDCLRPGVGGP
jgi:hypothetical protein